MVKKKVTVVMFHDDEMGGYSVIIPTIPRLATMGKDVAHSLAMAKECWEISIREPADWNYYELAQACSGAGGGWHNRSGYSRSQESDCGSVP